MKKYLHKYSDVAPTFVILAVMLALNIALQKNFFSADNLQVVARQSSAYILIAMAQTLVMLLGGINMGLGSLVSLASCLFATQLTGGPWDGLTILGVLAACAALNVLCGLVVYKFKLSPIVVSLAFSFLWAGMALQIMSVPGGYMPPFLTGLLTGMIGGFLPAPVLIIALFCRIWQMIRVSSFGIEIYAVGNNRDGAFSSGLNVRRAFMVCYALSGALIGMAALMLNAITTSGDPTIGDPLTINAVTAAVLGGVSLSGGKGKMIGSIAGGLVVSMLVIVLFYLKVSGNFTYIVEGAILIAAVSSNQLRKGGN